MAMPITPQAERAPALPEQMKDMKIFNFQIQIINIEKNKHKNHQKNIVRTQKGISEKSALYCTCGLAELVTALTQIILVSMDHHGTT